MIFFLLLLLLVMFNNAKFAPAGTFMKDYLSREKSNAIKGIFVILIVFSHYSQYVSLGGIYDESYIILKNHLNQMVVSMFWFYSGYGIMVSIAAKGFPYVKSIFSRRFLSVFLNFAIAIGLFLIVGLILGKTYPIDTILLSLIGWKAVGNSNWYMFAVLVLYLLTFAAFYILRWLSGRKAFYLGALLLTIFSVLFIFWQMKMDRPGYCYNTIIIFAFGCWYALLKDKIEAVLMHNSYIFSAAAVAMLAIYLVSFNFRWDYGIEGYTVWALSFTILVVMFTMKISLCNPILNWFGDHVFSIYILQRIPMMLLQHIGLSESHKYVFLIASFAATILMAQIFDGLTGKLQDKIWK